MSRRRTDNTRSPHKRILLLFRHRKTTLNVPKVLTIYYFLARNPSHKIRVSGGSTMFRPKKFFGQTNFWREFIVCVQTIYRGTDRRGKSRARPRPTGRLIHATERNELLTAVSCNVNVTVTVSAVSVNREMSKMTMLNSTKTSQKRHKNIKLNNLPLKVSLSPKRGQK